MSTAGILRLGRSGMPEDVCHRLGLFVGVPTRAVLRPSECEPSGAARTLAFSPRHPSIVVGYESGAIRTWSLQTGRPVLSLFTAAPTTSVAVAPCGTLFAAGSAHGWVRVCRLAAAGPPQADLRLPEAGDAVCDLAFSACGAYLAAGSALGFLLVWCRSTRAPVYSRRLSGAPVGVVAFSSRTELLACAVSTGRIFLVEPQDRVRWPSFRHGPLCTPVLSMAFSDRGSTETLVSLSQDGTAKVWPMTQEPAGRDLRRPPACARSSSLHPRGLRPPAAALSGDAGRVAAASLRDPGVHVWNASTGRHLHRAFLPVGPVHSLAWSPRASHLAMGLTDGSVRIAAVPPESPPACACAIL